MLAVSPPHPPAVIPAKAGTHFTARAGCELGPSFRWDDTEFEGRTVLLTYNTPEYPQ
jgi:hypothetical protein